MISPTQCPYLKHKKCTYLVIPCPLLESYDHDIECFNLPEEEFHKISVYEKR